MKTEYPRTPKWLLWTLLFLLFGFAFGRLLFLSADPSYLVLSDHLTDEGWYTQNARNHYLFGEWIMDEHNPALVLTPLFTLFQRAIMEVLGVSFLTIRLVSALSVIGSIFLVAFRLRHTSVWALLAALGIALNPLIFAYSRVAFVEPMQLAMLTSVWFFATSPKQGHCPAFLSGVFSGLAVATKPTAAVIAAMSLVRPFIDSNRRERLDVPRVMAIILGAMISLASVGAFVARFNSTFLTELSRESTISGGARGFDGLAMPLLLGLRPVSDTFSPLAGYWGIVVPVLFLLSVQLATEPPQAHKNQTQQAIVWKISLSWLFLGVITLMIQDRLQFRPRYWLNLLIPAVIILTRPHVYLPSINDRMRWLRLSVLGLSASFVFRPQYIRTIELFVGKIDNAYAMVLLFATIILVALAVTLGLAVWEKRVPPWMKGLETGRRVLLVVTAAYWMFATSLIIGVPTFTVRDISKSMDKLVGPSAVITGSTANTMVMETSLFAYETRDLSVFGMGEGVINGEPDLFGTTHVIVSTRVEERSLPIRFPVEVPLYLRRRWQLVPGKRFLEGYRYEADLYSFQETATQAQAEISR